MFVKCIRQIGEFRSDVVWEYIQQQWFPNFRSIFSVQHFFFRWQFVQWHPISFYNICEKQAILSFTLKIQIRQQWKLCNTSASSKCLAHDMAHDRVCSVEAHSRWRCCHLENLILINFASAHVAYMYYIDSKHNHHAAIAWGMQRHTVHKHPTDWPSHHEHDESCNEYSDTCDVEEIGGLNKTYGSWCCLGTALRSMFFSCN